MHQGGQEGSHLHIRGAGLLLGAEQPSIDLEALREDHDARWCIVTWLIDILYLLVWQNHLTEHCQKQTIQRQNFSQSQHLEHGQDS